MKKVILLLCLFPLLLTAQQDSISSGRYAWKEPAKESHGQVASAVLFEGGAHDLEWLQVSANVLAASTKSSKEKVPDKEEHLLIIKSGKLVLRIRDSVYTIGTGSIAQLMPGEAFSLQPQGTEPCRYYLMKYRSKAAKEMQRGRASGGSLVKDWNNVVFKPHDKGGRRDFTDRQTAMCNRFEMHVSTLKTGLKSHDPHMHKAPEIVLVTEGDTNMQIGDQFYKGGEGSIYFLASNVLHALQNVGTGNCTYFAIQFE